MKPLEDMTGFRPRATSRAARIGNRVSHALGYKVGRWIGRIGSRAMPCLLAILCGCIVVTTSGCSSIGAASGAVAAVASGTFTANPAVGLGVGITVQAATDEAVNRFVKNMHADQQKLIAETAGRLPVDGSAPWKIKHFLPVENGHGQVRVTREFSSALASCKEFAFSVQDGDTATAPEQWFTATACHDQSSWKWASAEPAVTRWGALQ